MDYKRFIIIGGGIAGVTAALEIRKCLPESHITLISQEKSLPYLRPLLSKAAFNSLNEEGLWMHPADWYREHRIELLTDTAAVHIDTARQQAALENGSLLPYDRLIYALGARPVIPMIKGGDKINVIALRTIADFKCLQRALLTAENVVVAGGGAIGLETAWEVSKSGSRVTVVENAKILMSRFLDRETSAWLELQAQARGVAIRTGVSIAKIKDSDCGKEVLLSDGSLLPCDLLILCCGISPDTALAAGSGIGCDRGVLVTAEMRTDQEDVFACGDCIQLRDGSANPGLWSYGIASGKIAGNFAAGMEGDNLAVTAVPELLLNAFETSLFSIGDVQAGDTIKRVMPDGTGQAFFKVNPDNGPEGFIKRFYQKGQLTGAILAGNLNAIVKIKEEINAGNGYGIV